ncbi:Clp protease N-terminal domain-containing protein [Actinotalea sp.]|uniref:Clp protease N-terminal domain-containing protein n=1 Tax=Actinotalea sp. TaxID=1872145 RepID=UPI002C5895E8|nr:Clp protease N-terminal domain-containing protein [Actinotalea sp.]HRA50597.1 Clp protease N-terminal domain-containing protein [Actinotalea sp.]
MFDRFTRGARAVVVDAQVHARRLGSPRIGPEHLVLAALVAEGPTARALHDAGLRAPALEAVIAPADDIDAEALGAIGIDLGAVTRAADELFGAGAFDSAGARTRGRAGRHLPFTAEAKEALVVALREARLLGDREIRTEHVVLGATAPGGGGARALDRCGVDAEAVRAALLAARDAA